MAQRALRIDAEEAALERLAHRFDVTFSDVHKLATAARAGGLMKLPFRDQQPVADVLHRLCRDLSHSAGYQLYSDIKEAVGQ